jgi:predicted phage terminase large subunit-like protein
MHRDFVADLSTLHTRRGTWLAREAPRGNAKSTYVSKAYPLWAILEGVEPFILLLSDTNDQAQQFLSDIRYELQNNERIARDYPHVAGIGPVWQTRRIVTRNGSQIAAFGAGSRVRGRGHQAERPTLVVVDDGNEKDDAFSATKRKHKWDWFVGDVMSAGSMQTNFLVVGTPIHREAISHRLKTTAGWRYKSYRSIMRWPDRMDLWQKWEQELTNLAHEDRIDRAKAYFAANEAEMTRGAELLWPERESLYDLMVLRAAIGPTVFDSEKGDKPNTQGASEWPSEYFDRPDYWFSDWPDDTEFIASVLALDPSKGASDGSDFQAHILARVHRSGTIYIEPWLVREDVTAMVTRSLDIARAFKPSEVVAETNSTMGLLIPEYERQLRERGQSINLNGIHNSEPKNVRIRLVTGYLSRGDIRVRNTQHGHELTNQWREFPNGKNDDGPDAVSIAIKRLQQICR